MEWSQEREAASRDDSVVAQESTSEIEDKKAEVENWYYRYFTSIGVTLAGVFFVLSVTGCAMLFLFLRCSNPKLSVCLLLMILIVFITNTFRMLRLRLKTLRRLAPKDLRPFVLFRVVLNADADKNSHNMRRLKTWTLSLRLKSYEEEE